MLSRFRGVFNKTEPKLDNFDEKNSDEGVATDFRENFEGIKVKELVATFDKLIEQQRDINYWICVESVINRFL